MDNQVFHQNDERCEKSSFFLSPGFFVGATIWFRQRLSRLTHLSEVVVRHASLAVRAGLVAASTSRRYYFGLVLILVVAPLSGVTYQLFDITAIDSSWYFRTWYDFLSALGPYFVVCFSLIGASLLFPQDSRKAYFLLPPLALYVAKMLWLSVAESNEEFNAFWSLIPYYFTITGGIVAFILIFTFNWLMTLHFHKREGSRARIDGIIDLSELEMIEDDEAMKILRSERKQFKSI